MIRKFIISHGAAASCWLEQVFEGECTEIPHMLSRNCLGRGAHIKDPGQFKLNYGINTRIIYPIRYPVDALISFARRGFFTPPLPPPDFNSHHVINIGGNFSEFYKYCLKYLPNKNWSIEKTLESFLDYGEDFFQVAEHISVWKDASVDIYFVKYEEMEDNWENICKYMDSNKMNEINKFTKSKIIIDENLYSELENFYVGACNLYNSI